MDLYCPRCGEPYDSYEVRHEFEPDERKAFFAGDGCPCCIGKPVAEKPFIADAASAIYDVLGHDLDGAACELEDLVYLTGGAQ